MQHLFCDAGQRRARMWKNTLIRSTFACISCTSLWRTFRLALWVNNHFPSAIQCTTAFVPQGSAERTCEKHWPVQPLLVYLARVWGNKFRLFLCVNNHLSMTFQCNTPLWRRAAQKNMWNMLIRSTSTCISCASRWQALRLLFVKSHFSATFQWTPFLWRRAAQSNTVTNADPFNLHLYILHEYGKSLDCFLWFKVTFQWPFIATPPLCRREAQSKHGKNSDPFNLCL